MRNSASWARFLALWPTLRRLIVDDGYSARAVHRVAVEEEVWCGGYTVFRCHVRRARKRSSAAPGAELQETNPAEAAVKASSTARESDEREVRAAVASLPEVDPRDLWSRIANPNAAKGPYVYGADDDS